MFVEGTVRRKCRSETVFPARLVTLREGCCTRCSCHVLSVQDMTRFGLDEKKRVFNWHLNFHPARISCPVPASERHASHSEYYRRRPFVHLSQPMNPFVRPIKPSHSAERIFFTHVIFCANLACPAEYTYISTPAPRPFLQITNIRKSSPTPIVCNTQLTAFQFIESLFSKLLLLSLSQEPQILNPG